MSTPRLLLLIGLIVAPILIVGLAMLVDDSLKANGLVTNVGFLVFGSSVAVAAGLLNDWVRRKEETKDLARALHTELAEHLARCAFDFEVPWKNYLTMGHGETRGSFDLRKFAPMTLPSFPA